VGHDGREAWRIIQELLFEGETHDRIQEVCAALGLTPGLAKALVHLSSDEGVAMRDLAEHWSCDASYVTALIDGLEQRGMAERRPNPGDRRVKSVALTGAGATAKAEVLNRMWDPPKAFDVLTPREEQQLRLLLAKVAAADARVCDVRNRLGASGFPSATAAAADDGPRNRVDDLL
jgi:DNA-binding MarR family transcriptional regulator